MCILRHFAPLEGVQNVHSPLRRGEFKLRGTSPRPPALRSSLHMEGRGLALPKFRRLVHEPSRRALASEPQGEVAVCHCLAGAHAAPKPDGSVLGCFCATNSLVPRSPLRRSPCSSAVLNYCAFLNESSLAFASASPRSTRSDFPFSLGASLAAPPHRSAAWPALRGSTQSQTIR